LRSQKGIGILGRETIYIQECFEMNENTAMEKQIGKPDGPTSYFVIGGKNYKPTFKQRFQKWRFDRRKARLAKKLKANPHTLDEVCNYMKAKYGFVEVSEDAFIYQVEYRGVEINYSHQNLDTENIELCVMEKKMDDGEYHVAVEKRHGHIAAGATGSRELVKKFPKVIKDMYRYYGVTKEDIKAKSKRYEELLCRLASK
jgi:hypothetical protein